MKSMSIITNPVIFSPGHLYYFLPASLLLTFKIANTKVTRNRSKYLDLGRGHYDVQSCRAKIIRVSRYTYMEPSESKSNRLPLF